MNQAKKALRVLLADVNPDIIKWTREILYPTFDVVGVCSDGGSVFRQSKLLTPDLIVIAISLGSISGLTVVHRLRQAGCTAKIVFLTVHPEAEFVSAAFAEGASAYVLKSQLSELPDALSAAVAGRTYISSALLQHQS